MTFPAQAHADYPQPDRFYCKGDQVIILPGPFCANLIWGSIGRLSRDQEPREIQGDLWFYVEVESGRWKGEVVSIHKSQLCSISEAISTVASARAAEVTAK